MNEVKKPVPIPVVSGPMVSQAQPAAVESAVPMPQEPPIVLSQASGSGWAELPPTRPHQPRPAKDPQEKP